ncbi:MAG: HU family DNA-binding protein [Gammaproteobacteria bacterium]|nr:HU family DNA-binding protein [Rhodocyclales bacterium]MBU1364492.1 HU family DNA-binding protein [Gammaproteobacteria bacterium]MBU1601976.1 HU family DNA-binding protein [Gammaproteobacteria bacterium]MBU2433953.1 HU family DNA-binding protein [Gammaproteobacteria bacterium]MBU2447777.1 HU family DNA-binding protein [Gammaproteobacteria bacterium]
MEIRGFGSCSLNYRATRQARNPKTGQPVTALAK